MKAVGQHLLAELWNCSEAVLNDADAVEKLMLMAALASGADILHSYFHTFSPQGVTGIVAISESHLSVHTWPEFGYAAVDVFTCGDKVNPQKAVDLLIEGFQSANPSVTVVSRGFKEGIDGTQRDGKNFNENQTARRIAS